MSGRSSAVMFVCLVAIALASNQAENFDSSGSAIAANTGMREPASVSNGWGRKPDLASVATSSPILKHTHKIRGPLTSSIELVGAAPERAGDVFVLSGVIRSEQAVPNAQYKWVLPKGVELLNGELSGVISFVEAGQQFPVQLTLRTLVDGNRQVHLSVRAAGSGVRFGDTAQFNTILQKVYEVSRKELKKSTQEYRAEQDTKGLKVFH